MYLANRSSGHSLKIFLILSLIALNLVFIHRSITVFVTGAFPFWLKLFKRCKKFRTLQGVSSHELWPGPCHNYTINAQQENCLTPLDIINM